MPKVSVRATPIMGNAHVTELLSILKTHKSPGYNDLLALLGQIGVMEKQLDAMVTELAAMRRDLAEAERRNHPIQNVLRKAVIIMQKQALNLRDKLAELKQAVIDGCQHAVQAFKEKGISALDNIARFFKVRPILEAIHTGADKAAQSADRAIGSIEAASARYHEAGRNLQNAGRALTGRAAVQEARPNGMAAKTFTAPFRAVRACYTGIGSHAEAAAKNMKRLEERAKPSIQKTMEDLNKKIAEKEQDKPGKTRTSAER